MTSRVRALFFGSGEVALPVLSGLAASGLADLELVVTAPPRPAGRGRELRSTPVGLLAAEQGLRVSMPATLRSEEAQAELRALAPDLIVLADYGRLIPPAVLDLPRHGALNVHPSLLPRHRGAAPVAGTILAGDAVTGVTVMQMDAGLDTGPIVAQRELALAGDEVAPELEARLARLGAELLVEVLPDWLAGRIEARPQPADGATLTRPLRREDGRLDAARPARELERQVRAYQPWPGSFLEIGGERVIVWRAAVLDATAAAGAAAAGAAAPAPGAVVPVGDVPGVVTADGILRLDEVQPAGRRRMPAADFCRGHRP